MLPELLVGFRTCPSAIGGLLGPWLRASLAQEGQMERTECVPRGSYPLAQHPELHPGQAWTACWVLARCPPPPGAQGCWETGNDHILTIAGGKGCPRGRLQGYNSPDWGHANQGRSF